MVATILLRSETLGIRPEFDSDVTSQRRGLQSDPEMHSRRARQINERALRRYRPTWKHGSRGQRVLLLEAWNAAKGPVLAMNYTPIGLTDASAHEVQFVPGSLSIKRVTPMEYAMSAELVEVR